MRIVSSHHGKDRVWEIAEHDFVVGRAHENSPKLLDLSSDNTISRVHARLWKEDNEFWIEDCRSSHGTLLNNVEIKGMGKQIIRPGDVIAMGETTLCIESLEVRVALAKTNYLESGSSLLRDEEHTNSGEIVAHDLDATIFDPTPRKGSGDVGGLRLKLICDLPLQFAAKTGLKELLPTIVDRLIDLIPNADNWALALRDPKTNTLLLKAHRSQHRPHVSESFCRRAIDDRKAFIWNRASTGDVGGTILETAINTAMYAPLLWQDEACGVICAESRSLKNAFDEEDLRLIVFMAHYAAMAIGSHRLQEKLREESVLRAKLLRQFSPKVAERILTHPGHLRLGGERSEVSILNSDIRGFTALTSEMDPDDIVEILNDYFAILVPLIFAYHGTIDKFMGDGILAVFGSPEPDFNHHEHAVLAAIDMLAAIKRLNENRRLRELPCAKSGIGIHCGEVVHGFVGTSDRMEFTVIGDVVNKASRMCTGAAGGELLISPEVHERVWQIIQAEQTTVRCKHEGNFPAYRVSGLRPGVVREDMKT
jgi:adenylate cyclase